MKVRQLSMKKQKTINDAYKIQYLGGLEMGRIKLVLHEQWDQTLFYLATLSLVFLVGCCVRNVAG